MKTLSPETYKNLMNAIDKRDPARIAGILRDCPTAFSEASINADSSAFGGVFYRLHNCLQDANAQDAIVIFNEMAGMLEQRDFNKSKKLIGIALTSSAWSLQAIETHPSFFLKHMERESLNAFDMVAGTNAMFLLASSSHCDLSYEETRRAIVALKNIGVSNERNPLNGGLCIHQAARSRSPETFRAFVDEFPGDLDESTTKKWRPLHAAASTGHPDNVRLLLDRGVDPRPVDADSTTPLHSAADGKRPESVMILLDSGAYSDSDFNDVFGHSENWSPEEVDPLRAYHAAVKARNILSRMDHQQSLPRLL